MLIDKLLFQTLIYCDANSLINISQLAVGISLSLFQSDPIKRLPLYLAEDNLLNEK